MRLLRFLSEIIIFLELGRVGNLGELQALGAFALDEVRDQLLREDVPGGEVVVILLQRVQRLLQRGGQLVQLRLLLLLLV